MPESASAVSIRPVHQSEHAALGAIIVDAYLRDGFLRGPDDPYADYLRDVDSRSVDAEVLVAADGERLLGGVTLVPPGSPLAEIAGAGESEIRALAVDPAGRGRGVGTALARACVERSRDGFDAKRVVLSSLPEQRAAHRIYERMGFRREPERDWYPIPDIMLLAFALDC